MTPSLKAFVAGTPQRRGGKPCWVCSLPEIKQLDQGRRDGVSMLSIRSFMLAAKDGDPPGLGYSPEEATIGRIRSHFEQGKHHERTK